MNIDRRRVRILIVLAFSAAGWSVSVSAEAERIEIESPIAWQVVQRQAFDPAKAHANNDGGPALGFANVQIGGTSSGGNAQSWQYRIVPLGEGPEAAADWKPLAASVESNKWSGSIHVPAGGWYRLEIRAEGQGRVVGRDQVEPFGVGEVFLIAGQSYAAGANDELLSIEDPEKRVVSYDTISGEWRVANDPQPNVGDGGTIWPPLGDLLVPLARVPVGFVNVAAGGSASREWLPGAPYFEAFSAAGKKIGRFRAILWQQGESDVIEKTPTEVYVRNLPTIRQALEQEWRFAPPWLLAKSTLHPTVYDNPTDEGQIRAAIHQLWNTRGFRPGPDTDILGGINRGGPNTRQHFSGIGQRRAAQLWFAAIWQELNNPQPEKSKKRAGRSARVNQ
jgi:hypothetical protein